MKRAVQGYVADVCSQVSKLGSLAVEDFPGVTPTALALEKGDVC